MNFHIAYRFQILNFGEKKINQSQPKKKHPVSVLCLLLRIIQIHHTVIVHLKGRDAAVAMLGCVGRVGVVMCDGGDQGPGTRDHTARVESPGRDNCSCTPVHLVCRAVIGTSRHSEGRRPLLVTRAFSLLKASTLLVFHKESTLKTICI